MVCLGILSEQEARDAVKWDFYVAIASAFGIGTAMINSGIDNAVAEFLVGIGEALNIGEAGVVGVVYGVTSLLSNVISNSSAAAALLFPIAMNAAEDAGVSRAIMAYTLMLGASASFLSPFGHPNNLLVFGPGGYSTLDFVKIGLPLQIVLWITSVLYLSVIKSAYIRWGATSACLFLISVSVVGFPFISSALRGPRKERKPK
jgi:di/tricarboxylate transporter